MTQERKDFLLHSLMCLIGGFLGAYAILNRAGNLGSAQTANLIYLLLTVLGHNYIDFLLRLCGAFLYFAAIAIYVYLAKKTDVNLQKYSILVDIVGMIILCFIPKAADPVLGILPLFFMMATQWSVFHGYNGHNSSTTFSTNNFRQTILAMGEYMCEKDQKQLDKAKFFANSLLWYHIGVVFSFFAVRSLSVYATLLCVPVGVSLYVIASLRITDMEVELEVS